MSEQPRVPAGSPKGGEWASKGGADAISSAPETGSDVDEKLREEFASLSGAQQTALRTYWHTYASTNAALRAGTEHLETRVKTSISGVSGRYRPSDVVKDLDDAFKHPKRTKSDEYVYRGLSDSLTNLSVGDEIHDKGYVSTTRNPDVARSYASPMAAKMRATTWAEEKAERAKQITKQVIVKIKLAKGSAYLPGAPGHAELVLNRNSGFRVTAAGKDSAEMSDGVRNGDVK